MVEGEIVSTGESEDPKKGDQKGNEKDQSHNAIPEELLKGLPEEQKKMIRSITSFQGMMPMPNPILNKVTSEHITKLLANADEEDKRDREERGKERGHNYKIMVTAIISIIVIGVLLVYANQIQMFEIFVGAVLGFCGGFGVGRHFEI